MQRARQNLLALTCLLLAGGICGGATEKALADEGGGRATRGGNYLVVAPPYFATSTPLVELMNDRAGKGFSVDLYTVYSGTSNTAIKAYIQSLWGTSEEPDYVVIVGDTSGTTSSSDTIPHFVGTGDKGATTDLPYVCWNGASLSWYPDACVGRLSASDIDELQYIVDKTLFVEAGSYPDDDYTRRGAFIANSNTQGMAEPTHEWVIDNYFTPNEYVGIKVYGALGAGTADVANAVNNGCLFCVYYGHSGSTGWMNPPFGTSDVKDLENTGLYGLTFGWSCNTAHFSYDECFGEAWIRGEEYGSAAYMSASDYIYWGSVEAWQPSTVHEKSFFASFFEKDIWEVGPAHVEGLYKFLTDYGEWDGNPAHAPDAHEAICHNFFEEFVLLGDPALHLPERSAFAVQVTPSAHEVCSPPTQLVAYEINVREMGDFQEYVILSVSGVPEGATYHLDLNNQFPPFVSHLTVDNLTFADPGDYQIQIDGDSFSLHRSTTVELQLADTPPVTVRLNSPPNGATEVGLAPTLAWDPVGQAMEYEIQLADNPTFTPVEYTTTVGATSHVLTSYLESDADYYWRVRANNACGEGMYDEVFTFHTMSQPDYFTELFDTGKPLDVQDYSIMLTPDGSGDYYEICGGDAAAFPVNPMGGTEVNFYEDGCEHVNLSGGATVGPYGQEYSGFYICDNGYITFTSADNDYTESLAEHFAMPRLSALYNDLSKPGGGTVSWRQLGDRAAVTYEDVPEWNSSNSNNFQVEMFFDGRIRYTWLEIESYTAVVGISAGNGMPGDFMESDLSSSDYCPGDLDGDCDIDLTDHAIFVECMGGPDVTDPPVDCDLADFINADLGDDGDVDLADFMLFEQLFTGSAT